MVTKTLVNLKKISFYKFEYTAKKREGVGGGCGTRMILNFGGVWHKNDLDVKYTPLGYDVMMRVVRTVVRTSVINTTENHYNFVVAKPLVYDKGRKTIKLNK